MPGVRPDQAQQRRALEEAALEVLETMCFEFPVAEPEAGGAPGGDTVRASARFEGSLRGVLHVALTADAAQRLAAAFLGMEEDGVGEPQVLQMASELANMLCGATMSRLEPHGRLRIAPPVAERGGARLRDGSWLRFPLERGAAAVMLLCEEES